MRAIIFIAIIFIITACGPNPEQTAAIQKVREDSIRLATKNQIEKVQALKNLLTQTETEKEGLSNRLMIFRADLVAATDKLGTIREYQLLRTSEERERQIRNQVMIVQQLEKEIQDMQDGLVAKKDSISMIKIELKKYE